MPAGDVHGDALDPGAERRFPHARPHDCAHAARFRVHRCPDVQVTTSGSASAGSASAVGNHSTVRRPATAALTVGSLSDVGGWRSVRLDWVSVRVNPVSWSVVVRSRSFSSTVC